MLCSGITGMTVRLDERADSEGNFSVLAFKPTNFSDDFITCSYSMIPVSHFQQSNREFPVRYMFFKHFALSWGVG